MRAPESGNDLQMSFESRYLAFPKLTMELPRLPFKSRPCRLVSGTLSWKGRGRKTARQCLDLQRIHLWATHRRPGQQSGFRSDAAARHWSPSPLRLHAVQVPFAPQAMPTTGLPPGPQRQSYEAVQMAPTHATLPSPPLPPVDPPEPPVPPDQAHKTIDLPYVELPRDS